MEDVITFETTPSWRANSDIRQKKYINAARERAQISQMTKFSHLYPPKIIALAPV